jgi:hypothetical protein
MSSGQDLRRRSTVSSRSKVEHGHRTSTSGHHRRHRSRRDELDEEPSASSGPVYRERGESISTSPQQPRIRVVREEPRQQSRHGDGTWMLRTFGVAPVRRSASFRDEYKPQRVTSVRSRRDGGDRVERAGSGRRRSSEGVRGTRPGMTRYRFETRHAIKMLTSVQKCIDA